ncbi:MAG: YraN family protein [Chitinophagaceae bacterium]
MAKSKQHIETGNEGEALAATFIEQKGFLILERNWRFRHCEVDIIASKEKTIHFFEVKTRTGNQLLLPEASVNSRKMNKLKEAASEYLYLHPEWKWLQFNVLAITLHPESDPEIFMIEDVF